MDPRTDSNVARLTTEQRREIGRQGGLASAAARRAASNDPLHSIKQNLKSHFDELQRAARREGKWKDLPATSALTALKEVIAYGMGRPIALDKQTPAPVESEGDGSESAKKGDTLTFE